MTTIISKLEAHPHNATDAQVEQLAHDRYTHGLQVHHTEGIYLKVVVAGCQAQLGMVKRGRAPNAQAQLAVLDKVHDRFYAAVLRGVTTTDIAADDTLPQDERQRRTLARNARSAFARSTKSTLASYAKAGGDLRALDLAKVSKASLRAFVTPPPTGDKTTQQVAKGEGVLLRAIRRQARASPDAARESIERCMADLQKILDGLGDEGEPGATTTLVATGAARGHTRTRVGTPMLNRPAAP
jgi:hypothetical protein